MKIYKQEIKTIHNLAVYTVVQIIKLFWFRIQNKLNRWGGGHVNPFILNYMKIAQHIVSNISNVDKWLSVLNKGKGA